MISFRFSLSQIGSSVLYLSRSRTVRHPEIHCWPIDHDPILSTLMLVRTVRSAIHHRRRMCNSTLDWLSVLPPTSFAWSCDFCPATNNCKEHFRVIIIRLHSREWDGGEDEHYLLQNASHVPFALTGLRFFASLTSTCNEPLDDELRELDDDFMLPNFRSPLLMDEREK